MKPAGAYTTRVRSAAGDYEVLCGRGLLQHLAREAAVLGSFSSVHIVSSPKVWRALGRFVPDGFPGRSVEVHRFDDAESAKNLRNVEAIARKLVRAGADRKSLLVAIGGGVVGDVVGFVAACYLRGV